MDLTTFTMVIYMFVILPLMTIPATVPSWIIQAFESLASLIF